MSDPTMGNNNGNRLQAIAQSALLTIVSRLATTVLAAAMYWTGTEIVNLGRQIERVSAEVRALAVSDSSQDRRLDRLEFRAWPGSSSSSIGGPR